MFLARRPTAAAIDRFLQEARDAPLSYGPVGILDDETVGGARDHAAVVIGHGAADFARARSALMAWRQFDLGWVELFPRQAPVAAGTVVAVLIRHLGFWSLNGCRVLYGVGGPEEGTRFGYAYGTLTSHAEAGEELFDVCLDRQTGEVVYRIRAISWPRAPLARIGQPFVRVFQARFRAHSAAAMRRAVRVAPPT
jgi:uncharacterized protein (UPF0548 family)